MEEQFSPEKILQDKKSSSKLIEDALILFDQTILVLVAKSNRIIYNHTLLS